MLRRWTYQILCVLLLQGVAYAQLTTGTVQGTVQDPSGAIVPGVELTLLNVDTNLTLVQRSNNLGTYVFGNVPPGTYVLLAKLENFKTSETTGLVVEVNRNTVVNVAIEPGDLAESVEVSAGADIIDTQSSVVRTNIGSKLITELPSNSRNPLQFAELAPGVDLNTGSLTGGSQLLGLGGVTANVSGARQQQNTFYLDGADNSAIRLNEGLQAPNVEAIAGSAGGHQQQLGRIRTAAGRLFQHHHQGRYQRSSRQLLLLFPRWRLQRQRVAAQQTGSRDARGPDAPVGRHRRRSYFAEQDVLLRLLSALHRPEHHHQLDGALSEPNG